MSDSSSVIKSCPFCGCEKFSVVTEKQGEVDMFAVRCRGCMARGPLSLHEFAVLNWQLRKRPTVDSTGFDMSEINKVLDK